MLTRFALFLAALFASFRCDAQPSFGRAQRMDDAWRFFLVDPVQAPLDTAAAARQDFDDSSWTRLRVPHDWGAALPMSPDAGSCQGYKHGGIAVYRRHLSVTAEDVADGGRIYVYFEGVYCRSMVFVNGHCLGHRPSGFASFLLDLTDAVRVGTDNVLAVVVDHSRENDARWYTGSGITRPVWMVRAPRVHLAQWGTAWRTPHITPRAATLEVDVETVDGKSQDDSGSTLAQRGKNSAAPQVSLCRVAVLDSARREIAATTAQVTVGVRRTVRLTVPHPQLWSVDTPYLYSLVVTLLADGRETDRSEVPLGLRTISFSADHGFALNGVQTKIRGVCLHDDAGVLGTAVPPAVWLTRLQTLKSLGVNAVRMSHNPHAPAFYDLCDRLGLLVMDEASDEWEFAKRKWLKGWNRGRAGFQGTNDFFEEWIDRDVADMVRRDRCHPSVVLWSIGNEVDYPNDPYSHPVLDGSSITQPMYGGFHPDAPRAERIGAIAQRLAAVVRRHDTSRPVTGALAGVVMSNETAYPEAVDVVGYNYTESRYRDDHARYPHRIIYGSENRHDLAAWQAVADNEHIFGQFLWTGADYLGESGPWPSRGGGSGLIDLAGRVKPIGHYRAMLWSPTPVCHLATAPLRRYRNGQKSATPHRADPPSPYASSLWNYADHQPVQVIAAANTPSVRLVLNGTTLDTPLERDPGTGLRSCVLAFRPGTLVCQGTDEAGHVLAADTIYTTTTPRALRVTAPTTTLRHPDDILTVTVHVLDAAGHPVPQATDAITCYLPRGLRLLGLENGDMADTTPTASHTRRAYAGTLTAYIAADPDFAPSHSGTATADTGSAAADNHSAASESAPAVPHSLTVTFSAPLLDSADLRCMTAPALGAK